MPDVIHETDTDVITQNSDIPRGQPLANVSNIKNMSGMFAETKVFNQPLENWDISNVRNMSGMFAETKVFNQPLEKWNTAGVLYMGNMFKCAESFNQPLEKWDVSNVKNMRGMFAEPKVLNQPDITGARCFGAIGNARCNPTNDRSVPGYWSVPEVCLFPAKRHAPDSRSHDWEYRRHIPQAEEPV